MRAGKLDRRITIQRFTETRDAFNNPVQTWADLAKVWASVEHIRDRERWAAQEVGASVTMRFQARWSQKISDVNAKDRILYPAPKEVNVQEPDARITFGVVAVKELGRRVGLELTASARAD